MDIPSSLHQDSIHGVTDLDPETPYQDPKKTCTRNSPCLQQGCMICSTPNNHIRNLNVAMNGSNASPTSPATSDRPQPPINHPILILTTRFQDAIQENDIFELTYVDYQYTKPWNLTWISYCMTAPTSMPPTKLPCKSLTHMPTHAPHYPPLRPKPWSTPYLLHHPLPVSSPLNSSLTTGAASPMTSNPGCPPSWTDSPWPGVTTVPNWF